MKKSLKEQQQERQDERQIRFILQNIERIYWLLEQGTNFTALFKNLIGELIYVADVVGNLPDVESPALGYTTSDDNYWGRVKFGAVEYWVQLSNIFDRYENVPSASPNAQDRAIGFTDPSSNRPYYWLSSKWARWAFIFDVDSVGDLPNTDYPAFAVVRNQNALYRRINEPGGEPHEYIWVRQIDLYEGTTLPTDVPNGSLGMVPAGRAYMRLNGNWIPFTHFV